MTALVDFLMDHESFPIKDGDGILIHGVDVVVQNIKHRLIEDCRIFHLLKAPFTAVEQIKNDCELVVEGEEHIKPGSVQIQVQDEGVTIIGQLMDGTEFELGMEKNNGF